MNDILDHRGPDAEGIFINKNNTIGLGNRRLSIIDIPGGKQKVKKDTRFEPQKTQKPKNNSDFKSSIKD